MTLTLVQQKYNTPELAEMQKMNRSGHPERIHLLARMQRPGPLKDWKCVHWEIHGGHRVLPPLIVLSWSLGPYPTTPDRDPEVCWRALAMGRWGCWLVVAVHVVVRGKEAMNKHMSAISYFPSNLTSRYTPSNSYRGVYSLESSLCTLRRVYQMQNPLSCRSWVLYTIQYHPISRSVY